MYITLCLVYLHQPYGVIILEQPTYFVIQIIALRLVEQSKQANKRVNGRELMDNGLTDQRISLAH